MPSVVVSATGKQWTIGTAIGAGMHGCVYTTSSPESGYWFWDPVVVLKLVSTAQGHVVENEQRVGRIANDRHLCRLLDSFAHPPDYHCFLYEQLEVTLEEVLQNKMHFDESHALFHIMLGVQALHRAGFLHRDLKPANVMFRDGVGKLIDYGFAAPIGRPGLQGAPGGPEYAGRPGLQGAPRRARAARSRGRPGLQGAPRRARAARSRGRPGLQGAPRRARVANSPTWAAWSTEGA